jgi:hypothetical protein
MWLIVPLLLLALVVVGFGVAIGAVIALTVKLFPVLLILAGIWLLVKAFGGPRRERHAARDHRAYRDQWQRHGRGGWAGWEQGQAGWHGWEHAPASGPGPQATRPHQPTQPAGSGQATRPMQPVRPTEPAPQQVAATQPSSRPVRRELPIDVKVKVEQIRRKADVLLGYADRFPPYSQDLHIVRQTAADYLPRTVDAYLKLMGEGDPVIGATGKTALEELKVQLALLDSKLDEIAEDLQAQDIDRIVANRRFLEERFKLRDEARAADAATGEIEAA